MKIAWFVLLGVLSLAAPKAQAQCAYVTNSDGITATITGYSGSGGTGTAGILYIPDSTNGLTVTCIAPMAFRGCGNLIEVEIPGSVTNIGEEAFDDCTSLIAIGVDPTNSFYSGGGGTLFDINQSTLIQCPSGYQLPYYLIPGSVTNIGDYAFDACAGLSGVTIPAGVSSIGEDAFFLCSKLINITIPGTVTNIGEDAFDECGSLTAITVDATNSFYSSVDGVLYDITQSALLQYPGGLGGNFTAPATVTNIGNYVFDSCARLSSVTMPAGVTGIADDQFYGCSGLTNAIIPDSAGSIGSNAFFLCSSLPVVTIPAGVTNIAEDAFAYCSSLTNVAIPGNVANIGDYAFNDCTSLTSVTIPGSVTNIGNYAFYDCGSLTNATIADGVSSIGSNAFAHCPSLVGIAIPASVNSIGPQAFAYCTNLTAINVDPANPSYSSVNGVLFDAGQSTLVAYPGGLGGSYTISNGVTSLADYAFYGCSGLTGVTIPASVTNLGNCQFYDCVGLTNAIIGNGVTSIGNYAFFAALHLNSVTIPASVTNIGNAFNYHGWNLTNAYFQGNPPVMNSAFASYQGGLLKMMNGFTIPVVYYLPGTTGWGSTFDHLTTLLWNPLIQAGGSSFGVQTNHFGFNITGTLGLRLVVQSCTNLANPVWTPLQSIWITSSPIHFADPFQSNNPGRYYRIVGQ
jgi:hypothetical protein